MESWWLLVVPFRCFPDLFGKVRCGDFFFNLVILVGVGLAMLVGKIKIKEKEDSQYCFLFVGLDVVGYLIGVDGFLNF
jgi:hypothetical protein